MYFKKKKAKGIVFMYTLLDISNKIEIRQNLKKDFLVA